jgi:hypothetical protein
LEDGDPQKKEGTHPHPSRKKMKVENVHLVLHDASIRYRVMSILCCERNSKCEQQSGEEVTVDTLK